ncbi:MAG: YcjX family protein, partial [Verrucomicrobia bacterium]|nr:YcjX family protein [Verrucomicrobiota bacterium]
MRQHPLRIGVLGFSESGKTVFLTSLLDHFQHQSRSGSFPLFNDGGKPFQLTWERRIEATSVQGFNVFPFESNRQRLQRFEWPVKTGAGSEVRHRFVRSDWAWRKMDLDFFDLPGERVIDVLMCGSDYSAWSRCILQTIQENDELSRLAEPFLRLVYSP